MEAKVNQLRELAEQINAEHNTSVDEFNEIFDQLETATALITKLEDNATKSNSLLVKQETVILAAVDATKRHRAELNASNANFKELQRLDPKRLAKQNKGYKETIADLKERLQASEKARKNSVNYAKEIAKVAKTEGNAAFHFDPDTSNTIRVVPTLHVSKTNVFNGVVGSPVLEFTHHAKGITRQGTLLMDGTVGWARASDSAPNKEESKIALDFLLTYCKQNNVKYKEIS